MRRSDPIVLAGLDDHDAIHHFIRVQGRRPTAEELSSWQQSGARAAPSPAASSPVSGGAAGLAGRVRRGVGRLITRA